MKDIFFITVALATLPLWLGPFIVLGFGSLLLSDLSYNPMDLP